MIKSTSTIRTLAIATLLLLLHLAFNRIPHTVTGFSFDYDVALYSRAVVGVVPNTHHHVVGIHRPVPLQLRDQQQQQQQHRSILLADSILFQTLSDTTKHHDDSKSTTAIMTMPEEASTPQWKSDDGLLKSGKMMDLADWYSSCLSDAQFNEAKCNMLLIEQRKRVIASDTNDYASLNAAIAVVGNMITVVGMYFVMERNKKK